MPGMPGKSRPNEGRARGPQRDHEGDIIMQMNATLTKEEKDAYRAKAQALLDRVKNGEDFATLATAYSQDPGSAVLGGDLGFGDRNGYVKE